jgi:hypothetical protein
MFSIKYLIACACVVIIAACGGGNSSDNAQGTDLNNKIDQGDNSNKTGQGDNTDKTGQSDNTDKTGQDTNTNSQSPIPPLTPPNDVSPRIPVQQLGSIGPDITNKQTGNPFVPGYTADGTVFYDSTGSSFYLFGTNDGNGLDNVWPPQVWISPDFKNWTHRDVVLPSAWFEDPNNGWKSEVWAPSIIKHPSNGNYYLTYSIHSRTFIASSSSPAGPWVDANGMVANNPLFQDSSIWGQADAYDGQLFVDGEKVYLTFGGWGNGGILSLKFDDTKKVSVDNGDVSMVDTSISGGIKYKRFNNDDLRNYNEASFMFKRNEIYYLMWTPGGSQGSSIHYATSDSPTGRFTYKGAVLSSDNDLGILGPAHNSVFSVNGKYYISYHRQHYPFIDSKRQACLDEMSFNNDGTIKVVKPTHTGVGSIGSGQISTPKVNLAFGKPTLTSSDREYIITDNNKDIIHPLSPWAYGGKYAVDENWGSRWDPGLTAINPWLIVDLGLDKRVGSIETTFEYISKKYKYKIEFLENMFAGNLTTAAGSAQWHTIIDKTSDGSVSPDDASTSTSNGPITARYLRLTITGAVDLPSTSDGWGGENPINSFSVSEFKVFEASNTSLKAINTRPSSLSRMLK